MRSTPFSLQPLVVILTHSTLFGIAMAQLQGLKSEQLWAAVVVQTFGERVPLLSPELSILTPLGAMQMQSAGQYYRQRYIAPSQGGSGIQNITVNQFDTDQLTVATDSNPWTEASAQAFLSGLYPPTETLDDGWQNRTTNKFANGTLIYGPLNGTQYMPIDSPTYNDPRSIWLSGESQCSNYASSVSQYLQSPTAQSTNSSTLGFYSQLTDVFSTAIPGTRLNWADNAYGIWEYLNYMIIHNDTVASTYSGDLAQARYLADSYATATLTNFSSFTNVIAGRTLSYAIGSALESNVDSDGNNDKLTTLFTSYEPFMSFAALFNLTENYNSFAGLPNIGASFAVELFSQGTAGNGSAATFPSDPSELYVRIGWLNGTNGSTDPMFYPLTTVVNGNSSEGVPYNQFIKSMQSWLVGSAGDWCLDCQSSAVFCPYFYQKMGSGSSASNCGGTLSPVAAGVIGAATTLVTLMLILAAGMVVFGVRFRRDGAGCMTMKAKPYTPSSPTASNRRSRNSGLGGFKGDEKLASDIDLPGGNAAVGRMPGHNRSASWELKENKQSNVDPSAISPTTGISVMRNDDDDLDLGDMKAVETRESV